MASPSGTPARNMALACAEAFLACALDKPLLCFVLKLSGVHGIFHNSDNDFSVAIEVVGIRICHERAI